MYVSPANHWNTEVSLATLLRPYNSPSHYVYGYEIEQVEAVKYLVNTSPDWARSYSLIDNHFEAMEAIARRLSGSCGLTLYALPLWVGGGHMSFGIVFFDSSVAPANRTPEDAEKLVVLEQLLESTGISKTPKAKFELLCSAAYGGYPLESPEMAKRDPPLDWERNRGHEIISFIREFRRKMRSQREGGSGGGKRLPVKKQGGKSEAGL